MTAKDNLDYWKHEWQRILIRDCGMTREGASKVIELADLNGMFDPYKTLIAIQEVLNLGELKGTAEFPIKFPESAIIEKL